MTEVSNDIEKGVESMTTTEKAEDVVNPWEVASSSEKGVDYDKLISKSRPFRSPVISAGDVVFFFRCCDFRHYKRGLCTFISQCLV